MSKQNKLNSGEPLNLEEDSALRDLFKSSGYETAPEELSARVIAQIQSEEKSAFSPVQPLIPIAVWAAIGVLILVAVLYAFSLPSQNSRWHLSEWLDVLPQPSIQINLHDLLSVFQFVPKSLAFVLPVILLQLYFIKNYYDGQYSK